MEEKKYNKSLRVKISLFYGLLASMNLILFSVLIYDQQMSLLMNNFSMTSKEVVQTLLGEVQEISVSDQKDETYQQLQKSLKSYQVSRYRIFNEDGKVLHMEPAGQDESISDDLMRKTLEISGDTALFKRKYHFELDSENFNSIVLVQLNSRMKENIFLDLSLSLNQIQQTLNELYRTLGFGIFAGIVLHILFGFYVYRLIFVRVSLLKKTSGEMAKGNLDARIAWKMKQHDELDDLGNTFNSMAEKIEEQFNTVTRLNHEIQNELEIGKEVQSIFLPEPDFLKEYNPAILYIPMREVSGDIYTFFSYKNGDKGIFFADATGHGVSAALVTTISLMSLDSVLKEEKSTKVGAIINRLNFILSSKLEASFFACGVLFHFGEDHSITFVNAGLNSPLLVTGEDQIFELPQTGPPLGMLDDYKYSVKKAALKSKDKLVIYSDGVTEASNPEDEMYGLERMNQILLDNRYESCEKIKNLIHSDLQEFTGGVYRDDVSLIVLEIP
ncbi:MAG: SpoIIE family protein phosphatase [Spirochaetia bacterium]|nr:SpoIIE family protein phosphatase [Spirochaetia bacterium]